MGRTLILALVSLALVLGACGTSGPSLSPAPTGSIPAATGTISPTVSPSVPPTAPPTPSPTASATGAPTAAPTTTPTVAPTASTSPEPTSSLDPYNVCRFPYTRKGSTARSQLTAVRIGTHAGYDRIVFQFAGTRIPTLEIERATPPMRRDPSDLPIKVDGTYFLRLVMQNASGMEPDGTITYSGPERFSPDYPALTELVELGDFEAVLSWAVGRQDNGCLRVFALENPARLVIDLPHR